MSKLKVRAVKMDPCASDECDAAAEREGLNFSSWARRLMMAELHRLRREGVTLAKTADQSREVA